MSAPVDPFPDFVNGTTADGDQVDARFLALYRALDKTAVGLDASSIKDLAIVRGLIAANAVDYSKLDATVDAQYSLAYEAFARLDNASPVLAILSPTGIQNPASVSSGLFYFDGTRYPAGSRTARARVCASMVTNNIASSTNMVFGLYSVSTNGGVGVLSIGMSLTVGSTATIAVPGTAPTTQHAESAEFTIPSAGWYMLGVQMGGTPAANHVSVAHARLEIRKS